MFDLSYKNTDFHSHLIPKLDDGSQSYEESRELLIMMLKKGITDLFLTPHFNRPRFPYEIEYVKNKYEEFREYFRDIDINFHLGAEIFLTNEITDKKLPTMGNSNILMLELSFENKQPFLFEVIDGLIHKGYSIMIAHVERYDYFYMHRKTLFRDRVELGSDFFHLRKRGVLFQVNWSEIKKNSKKYNLLKENGMIDFIGSDKHRLNDGRPVIDFSSGYSKE
ncbi:MAG: protein-tyrosine phosphatase [Kosmotogales bacterium]|nr:protein-tyrosine phosphatase [Kosmotogales bacterium]